MVTADTKSPAPQPGSNARGRRRLRVSPPTGQSPGTKREPGPTTPPQRARRRASRLRGRAHASQAWRRASLARHVQGCDVSRRSANPLARGSAATKVKKEGRKPGGKNAPGTKKTALFDIVNRKRRGAMHRQGAGTPSRQRQRARVPAERAPRRASCVRCQYARENRDTRAAESEATRRRYESPSPLRAPSSSSSSLTGTA